MIVRVVPIKRRTRILNVAVYLVGKKPEVSQVGHSQTYQPLTKGPAVGGP